MRALSACLTVVLGLGVAAIAACSSSSSSDDSASGGTAGSSVAGTDAGGTSAGTSSGGSSTGGTDAGAAGDTSTGCAFLDGACGMCVENNCADSENTCAAEEVCENALTGTDGLIPCACAGEMTVAQCTATFSAVDDLSKAVADCAQTNCATDCGL